MKRKILIVITALLLIISNVILINSVRTNFQDLDTDAVFKDFIDQKVRLTGTPDTFFTLKGDGTNEYLFPLREYGNSVLVYIESDSSISSTTIKDFTGKLVTLDSFLNREEIETSYSGVPSNAIKGTVLEELGEEELSIIFGEEFSISEDTVVLIAREIKEYIWTPVFFSILIFVAASMIIYHRKSQEGSLLR